MESRFGHDFGRVRVHTDTESGQSALRMNAHAYTSAGDIVFAPGLYRPDREEGRALLVHELTHVVQQHRGLASQSNHAWLEDQARRAGSGSRRTRRVPGAPARANASAEGVQMADGGEGLSSAEKTPQEYIDDHESFFGANLDEDSLAADLFVLAKSPDRHEFILNVFKLLDAGDQIQVAELFLREARGKDAPFEEIAVTSSGRALLTALGSFFPEDHFQRKRLASLVAAGPQAEVERERLAALDRLKKGRTVDLTLYTDYKGEDTAEHLLESIAKSREKRQETDAAFPMEKFEDIELYFAEIARQLNASDFVRQVHLMGHGAENRFGFGELFYTSEWLRDNYKTGQLSSYMADGATVSLEGCDVAKGDAGKKYLSEIGRIFFGDRKTGYIKGSTCPAFSNMGVDMVECGVRTLRWPGDFR